MSDIDPSNFVRVASRIDLPY